MKINTIISESEPNSTRAVDAKGRTQREWINLVRAKFPEARIIQSKMIDGPVHAVLPDGRKTSWSSSVAEAAIPVSTPKAAVPGVAQAAPGAVKPVAKTAPAATTPAAAQPTAAPTAPTQPAAAPADPVQAATQSTLDKLGARAGAAPGSNTQQVADAYEQKILDRMGKRFGLPPGSTAEQVQAAQQAYLDKNDPAAAAQYKQQMSNIDADQPAGPAVNLTQPYSKDNVAAAGAQVQGKPAPAATPATPAPATAPGQAAPAEPSLGADFDAGLAAQKAGGSPVDIMLAQPAIAGNQKLVDAIGSAYGLPPGSSVEQVKAAAKGKTAAPAIEEAKKKEKEADYGDDYQDMVSRVKKLAGLGPLKTVYDPAKRVYKNIPTAVQPKK